MGQTTSRSSEIAASTRLPRRDEKTATKQQRRLSRRSEGPKATDPARPPKRTSRTGITAPRRQRRREAAQPVALSKSLGDDVSLAAHQSQSIPRRESGRRRHGEQRQHSKTDNAESLPRIDERGRNVSTRKRNNHHDVEKNKQPQIQVTELPYRRRREEYKECVVCTDLISQRHFHKQPPTSECSHETRTCKRCIRKWIRSEFESKMWDQMKCPECSSILQYDDVRAYAPSDVFRRYDKLSTRAALEAIPGFRWCIAKGCKSGQVHGEDFATPRFRCVACKASHCVVHEVPWHRKETCAEYDYRTNKSLKKAENEASKKLIKDMAKKCPGCKWHIEKNDGCDHMTCTKCKHQFCWVCLAPYKPIAKHGNRMHNVGCDYYVEYDSNL